MVSLCAFCFNRLKVLGECQSGDLLMVSTHSVQQTVVLLDATVLAV